MRRIAPLGLVALAACAPQSATLVEGQVTAFLSQLTSGTLRADELALDGSNDSSVYAIDCRELEEGEVQLPGALDICGEDWPPVHERWMARDGFVVYQQALDPWRGEAIMTSEGDFQVSFHHRLAGGEDLRWAFVVDPNFAPKRCVEGAGGAPELEAIDGDWVENWSSGVDGTQYFLNAYAYQFDPSNTCSTWSLPDPWRAGYGRAKFAGDEMFVRSGRYAFPAAYTAYEFEDANAESCPSADQLWYTALVDGEDTSASQAYDDLVAAAQGARDETIAEWARVGVDIEPIVHDNRWRRPDGFAAGLDGWVEMHYNWVRLDPGHDLQVGGQASGEFELLVEDSDGESRAVIRGSFSVDRIHRDTWVTKDIKAIKLRENETVLCGQDPS